jgi:prostamide/prostaglandin F2alpha synthase
MDARAVSRLTVLDTRGEQVQLGTLWGDRPAVIVWLRHFGCLFCREQVRAFTTVRDDIEERGARLIFVGNGGVHHLQDFIREERIQVPAFTDPALRTYRAIGARSGVLRTIGPQSVRAGLRALRSGARQTTVRGRPFQQGGVLVVCPGDRIAFTHLSRSAGDHPPISAVLGALPAATRRAAS